MTSAPQASSAYRETAARWHGGQSSRLYAFASSGAVVAGIDREIRSCLDLIERGEVSHDTDRVGEHERLRALLHHVEPTLAVDRAWRIGRERGENAAEWWHQETLGGRATGDPAVFDSLPGPADDDYTEVDLQGDCDWLEPNPDDRDAHARWSAALADLWETYYFNFLAAVVGRVTEWCRDELTEDVDRDHSLPQDGEGAVSYAVSDHELARARHLGADAALTGASALPMSEDEALAVIDATGGFTPPALSEDDWAGRTTGRTLTCEIVDQDVIVDMPVDDLAAVEAAIARAWEAGRDLVWGTALSAVAHRTLGHIPQALTLERSCDELAEKVAEAVHEPFLPWVSQSDEGQQQRLAPVGTPAGWVTEPVCQRGGGDYVVVYDPRRFDVTIGPAPCETSQVATQAPTWELGSDELDPASNGQRRVWIRDRVKAARVAVARTDHTPPGSVTRAVAPSPPGADGATRAGPETTVSRPEGGLGL